MKYLLPWLCCSSCSLLMPSIETFEVTPGACGQWSFQLSAEGLWGEAELREGDVLIGAWPLRGQVEAREDRLSAPGAHLTLVLSAGDAVARRDLDLPPVTFAPELQLAARPVPRVVGVLGSSCPIEGATVTATFRRADGKDFGANAGPTPLNGDGRLELPIPPEVRGPFLVELTVHRPDGGTLLVPPVALERTEPAEKPGSAPPAGGDADHDGFAAGVDCDDTRASVNPAANEAPVANQLDDDCDGQVDEGTAAFDDDGDGRSEDQGDCDDDDPRRFPGAAETPDCRDQNCDGVADEGLALPQVDDAYEPNNTDAQAWDLSTRSRSRFTESIRMVTAGAHDEEWLQFYSSDDLLDDWGIDLVAEQAADGAVYQVDVFGPTGNTSGRIDGEGAQVSVRGRMMSADTGYYTVRIRPVRVPPWCPLVLRIQSR